MEIVGLEVRERIAHLLNSVQPGTETFAFLSQLSEDWQQKGPDFLLELKNSLCYAEALAEILKAINSENDIERLLKIILDKAIALTGAERGFILLRDLEVARHFDGEQIVGEYKISQTMANNVRRTGNPVITGDAQSDERFAQYQSVRKYRALSILCVPIVVKEKPLGVIYLDNRLVRGKFHESHLKQLTAFAEQTAIALENTRLCQELSRHSQKLRLLNARLQRTCAKSVKPAVEALPSSKDSHCYQSLLGRSAKMQEIFCVIEKIKDYDIPVLIQGESGTGKELVAQAIHCSSRFRDKSFICENCAAIPEALFESELFGYEKGAFTGALHIKKGLFEEANGGTLFLDEIGDISMDIQKKLLRVLAEKTIRRVGGHEPIPVQVRIITATNRDLRQMVKSGEFREDLFYRLNGIGIDLPPLRKRREDIPLLITYFLKEACGEESEPKKIDRNLLSILISYDWPGNVRQLRNEIHRLVALSGPVLEARYLSSEILPPHKEPGENVHNLPDLLHDVEKREILKALEQCDYNKCRAAHLLGISRFTLQRKMDKYGLQ